MNKEKKPCEVNKLRYIREYNKTTYQQINLHINKKTEADMLSFLAGKKSVNGYIKGLIRDDMDRR